MRSVITAQASASEFMVVNTPRLAPRPPHARACACMHACVCVYMGPSIYLSIYLYTASGPRSGGLSGRRVEAETSPPSAVTSGRTSVPKSNRHTRAITHAIYHSISDFFSLPTRLWPQASSLHARRARLRARSRGRSRMRRRQPAVMCLVSSFRYSAVRC